jgi:hypothetical protein
MTNMFQKSEVLMTMPNNIRLRLLLLFSLVVTSPVYAQSLKERQALHQGFLAAQACEAEIDDDLDQYAECIRYLVDRFRRDENQRLGIHIQAWLMADLAARQHSVGAVKLRDTQRTLIIALLSRQRLTLKQIAAEKGLRWKEFSVRWKQNI